MNTSENDSVKSKTSIDITAPLPTTPYPPLPPIPEKVSLGDILPTVPPLPSENTQNETLELTINPPSPPEEEKQLEKLEQRNQSANQVEKYVVMSFCKGSFYQARCHIFMTVLFWSYRFKTWNYLMGRMNVTNKIILRVTVTPPKM